MAYYAFLDENSIVTEVIPGKNENELIEGLIPEEWYANFRGQKCVRTSFNTRLGKHIDQNGMIDDGVPFRKNYAAIGFIYDEERDAFIPPKPIEGNWTLNEETCTWEEIK